MSRHEKAGLVFCIILFITMIIAIYVDKTHSPDFLYTNEECIEHAKDSLSHALDIVNGPMDDGTVPVEDYYDDLGDDLRDALAWLELIS